MTENHKKYAIIELKDDIENSKNTCGSCDLWMTQQCDREKNHKVSSNENKCDQFKMKNWVIELISKREKELEELISKETESDFKGWGL